MHGDDAEYKSSFANGPSSDSNDGHNMHTISECAKPLDLVGKQDWVLVRLPMPVLKPIFSSQHKLNNLTALLGRNPSCNPAERTRHIELDYLRHTWFDAESAIMSKAIITMLFRRSIVSLVWRLAQHGAGEGWR